MVHQTETGPGGSSATTGSPALAVLATAPRPGLVLTGLCPPFSAAEAAALQTAWLKHIVQELPGAVVFLFGRPASALPMLHYFAGPGVTLREWRTEPAGAERHPEPATRLERVMAATALELFAMGHAPVLVRTSDAPDVPTTNLLACLAAARAGHRVMALDQRGAPWLLGWPSHAAAMAATAGQGSPGRRGPWARTVQNADDLTLLLHERAPRPGDAASLPVRDLQAALRFYETTTSAQLHSRSDTQATIDVAGTKVRLVQRGRDFTANGLWLSCDDDQELADLAAMLAEHDCIGAGDELATGVGGDTACTATDQDGNRLTFGTMPLAR